MSQGSDSVPSYRKPPIIEAVWSVQFAEMLWLLPPHTGLFWSRIRDRFPRCEEQAPIMHVVESESLFTSPKSSAELLTAPPLSRQWFISEAGTELVQLQRDRFCCNWRKVEPDDVYPRFQRLKNMFTEGWTTFCDFVSAMGEGAPAIDQCEMTYINHIERGLGWDAIERVGAVFPAICWEGKTSFLPAPSTLGAKFSFEMPSLHGRLHASLRHGVKSEGKAKGNELLLLEMTARGLPDTTDVAGLLRWFALARESIVKGFTDLTASKMHSLWEREI